jgi:hypothetical protein
MFGKGIPMAIGMLLLGIAEGNQQLNCFQWLIMPKGNFRQFVWFHLHAFFHMSDLLAFVALDEDLDLCSSLGESGQS